MRQVPALWEGSKARGGAPAPSPLCLSGPLSGLFCHPYSRDFILGCQGRNLWSSGQVQPAPVAVITFSRTTAAPFPYLLSLPPEELEHPPRLVGPRRLQFQERRWMKNYLVNGSLGWWPQMVAASSPPSRGLSSSEPREGVCPTPQEHLQVLVYP